MRKTRQPVCNWGPLIQWRVTGFDRHGNIATTIIPAHGGWRQAFYLARKLWGFKPAIATAI